MSVGENVEFPIGKKLFHLVLNPGTTQCPTVDLELVQTTRNVNGTRHSVRKFQPGKRAHLFRFSTFSGNFPVGRADETCSIYRRTRNSGNFDEMESALFLPSSFWREGAAVHRLSEMNNPSSMKLSVKIDGESREDCSDSKLKPLHFQIKTYYLSDANFQTDNVLGSISAVSRVQSSDERGLSFPNSSLESRW